MSEKTNAILKNRGIGKRCGHCKKFEDCHREANEIMGFDDIDLTALIESDKDTPACPEFVMFSD